MPRSMTGFGAAEGAVAGGRLQLDIKSVNHRHFSLQLKVPGALQPFEAPMREVLREHVDRGHVTIVGRWIEEPSRSSGLTINLARAREAHRALKTLRKRLKMKDKVSLDLILRQPDVTGTNSTQQSKLDFNEVRDVLVAAVGELVTLRSREGDQLTGELSNRFLAIAKLVENVETLAPARLLRERDRLRTNVTALLDGHTVAEDRIAQEIAFLADKMDITEETVRLRTHLAAARDTLASVGPVGKKLTFLSQEMLREINTIGSKANDATIAQDVIAMKGELEKIREQVENLE